MTYRQIEVFCVVAKHKSMKLAAEELRIDVATVSGMMLLLQNGIGQDLVLSTLGEGTELTEIGQRFFEMASPGIEQVKRAIEATRGTHGAEKAG